MFGGKQYDEGKKCEQRLIMNFLSTKKKENNNELN